MISVRHIVSFTRSTGVEHVDNDTINGWLKALGVYQTPFCLIEAVRDNLFCSFTYFPHFSFRSLHMLQCQNIAGKLVDTEKVRAKKGKAEHLYSALHSIQTTLKLSGMDHTVLPAINTIPVFLSFSAFGKNV